MNHKQGLHLLLVYPAISCFLGQPTNVQRLTVQEHVRDEDLRLLRPCGCDRHEVELEDTCERVPRSAKRLSCDLGRVRADHRAEDASSLVETTVRLSIPGGALGCGDQIGSAGRSGPREPRKVLAVPVVAMLVRVVWVVVPQTRTIECKGEYYRRDSVIGDVREADHSSLETSDHGIHHAGLPSPVIRSESFSLTERSRQLSVQRLPIHSGLTSCRTECRIRR
jgi:hypothetical protein